MKKTAVLFSLLSLVSCGSSTTEETKETERKSESLSVLPETEPEEERPFFDPNENSKRLILSSTNKHNTAYTAFEAEYAEHGIVFRVQFRDDDLFYGNIYNVGYDDNFELLLNQKTEKNGWDTEKTFHFLMNANGDTLFEKAISKNGLGLNYDSSLHVVKGENFDYRFSSVTYEDGSLGYEAEIYFSYDVLNTTYEEGFGNLTFCPGMRNSHDYGNDSTWTSYAKRGCKWASSSTFVCINGDGSFGE